MPISISFPEMTSCLTVLSAMIRWSSPFVSALHCPGCFRCMQPRSILRAVRNGSCCHRTSRTEKSDFTFPISALMSFFRTKDMPYTAPYPLSSGRRAASPLPAIRRIPLCRHLMRFRIRRKPAPSQKLRFPILRIPSAFPGTLRDFRFRYSLERAPAGRTKKKVSFFRITPSFGIISVYSAVSFGACAASCARAFMEREIL